MSFVICETPVATHADETPAECPAVAAFYSEQEIHAHALEAYILSGVAPAEVLARLSVLVPKTQHEGYNYLSPMFPDQRPSRLAKIRQTPNYGRRVPTMLTLSQCNQFERLMYLVPVAKRIVAMAKEFERIVELDKEHLLTMGFAWDASVLCCVADALVQMAPSPSRKRPAEEPADSLLELHLFDPPIGAPGRVRAILNGKVSPFVVHQKQEDESGRVVQICVAFDGNPSTIGFYNVEYPRHCPAGRIRSPLGFLVMVDGW